jgi:hypothetical protein
MQYRYREIIMSALFLCNYCLEFNESLWETSIPIGDAQIVALFRQIFQERVMFLDLLFSMHIEQ